MRRFQSVIRGWLHRLMCLGLTAAALPASAQSWWEDSAPAPGAVDYGQHAAALYNLFQNLTAIMIKVVGLVDAIAAIVALATALSIFFKMQHQEGDITKSISQLFWAVLFLFGATIVFPALFGFRLYGGSFSYNN